MKYNLKSCVAAALAFALLFTACGGAFADTLQLPADLKVIEQESFGGDASLDEVKIPWGAERIESRAFAESGLRRIEIPSTVTDIADDAFAGTNVAIAAPEDSCAKEYADAHGFAWEDTSSQDARDALDELEKLKDEEFSFTADQMEEMKLSGLEPIDADGIEDGETLEKIREFNAQAAEINAMIEACNEDVERLIEGYEELESRLSDVAFARQGDEIRIETSGMTFIMDEGLLQGGAGNEITDVDLSGSAPALRTSGGDTYYFYASDGRIELTRRAPVVANARAMSKAASADGWFDNSLVNGVGNALTLADLGLEGVKLLDSFKAINLYHQFMDLGKKAVASQKTLEWLRMKGFSEAHIAQESVWLGVRENINNANALGDQLDVAKGALKKLNDYSRVLGSLASLATAKKIGERFAKITEIAGHGHPNQHDTTVMAIELSDKLRDYILQLQILYATEGLFIATALVGELMSLASGGPLLTTVVDFGLKALVDGIDGTWMNKLYDMIIQIEDRLHTHVYGYLTDAETHEPVENAVVVTEDAYCYTDKMGYYRLYIPVDATIWIDLAKDGYKKDGFDVALVLGTGTQKDWEMKPTGVVEGFVLDEDTGVPLGGVTVSSGRAVMETGEDGYYALNLPPENCRIDYSRDGYIADYRYVAPVPGQRTWLEDVMLKSADCVVYGYVYDADRMARLPNVKVTLEDWETETNEEGYYEIPLTGETGRLKFRLQGYGPEFVEATRDIGGRVQRDAQLYPGEGVPIDEAHFPDGDFREYVRGFDADRNWRLSDDEIESVTDMGLYDYKSLKGIEYFYALKTLGLGGDLESLDISGLRQLESLGINSCEKLTRLNASYCTALKKVEKAGYLRAFTDLNLSGCQALETLTVPFCGLVSLDLSGLTSLKRLDCRDNRLVSLNVAGLAALETMQCDSNQLTALDLSGCASLTSFTAENNQISNVTLDGCTSLNSLDLYGNRLTVLDVRSLFARERINIDYSIGYDNNPGLEAVYFSDGVLYYHEDGSSEFVGN